MGSGARAEFCKANFGVWIGGIRREKDAGKEGVGRRPRRLRRVFLDSDS